MALIWPNVSCLFAGAASYICMALSGVTCSPPPPSATIEAIEAIEPHDEDGEGKPVPPLPPISTYCQGYRGHLPLTVHAQNSSHNNNPIKQHFTGQSDAGIAGTLLCSTID